MPSSLSHAMVAVAAGSVIAPRRLLRPFLIIGAVCAVLPDIDAIGRPFYGAAGDLQALGGHRAFTHSITFAVLLGFGASLMTLVDGRWAGYRSRLAVFVAVVTALHGVLDIFTSIGATTSPVQFFSPFLDARVRCLTASDQRAIQRTVSLLDPPRWLHASAVVRARHPVAASRISEPRQSRARSNGYAA